jgi:hypothetical protein
MFLFGFYECLNVEMMLVAGLLVIIGVDMGLKMDKRWGLVKII